MHPVYARAAADYAINDFVHHHAKNRGSSLYSTVSSGFGAVGRSGLNLVTRVVGPLTATSDLAPERTQKAKNTHAAHARAADRSCHPSATRLICAAMGHAVNFSFTSLALLCRRKCCTICTICKANPAER
jgi:hypothetical protein